MTDPGDRRIINRAEGEPWGKAWIELRFAEEYTRDAQDLLNSLSAQWEQLSWNGQQILEAPSGLAPRMYSMFVRRPQDAVRELEESA